MLLAVTSAVASSANDSSGRLSAAETPKVGPGVACVWVDPIKDPVAFRVVPIFLPPTAKNGGESAEQSKGKKKIPLVPEIQYSYPSTSAGQMGGKEEAFFCPHLEDPRLFGGEFRPDKETKKYTFISCVMCRLETEGAPKKLTPIRPAAGRHFFVTDGRFLRTGTHSQNP